MIGRIFKGLRYEPMAGEPVIPTRKIEVKQLGIPKFIKVERRKAAPCIQ